MRLGKLRYNNTVKADHCSLFGLEEVSSQWEGLCVWAHCIVAPLSPCQRTPLGPSPWAANAVHSFLPVLLLSTSCVSDTGRSYPSKRWCFLLKITPLPNGKTGSELSAALLHSLSSLSACVCPWRDHVASLGFEYLSHDEDGRLMSPVQTTPPASWFLFPAALGGLRGLCNLACPRPNSWRLPAQSSFCFHFPISGDGKLHYGDVSPRGHLTQDKNKKPSLSMVCMTPLCLPGSLCSHCTALLFRWTRVHLCGTQAASPQGASTLCDQLCHISCPVTQQTCELTTKSSRLKFIGPLAKGWKCNSSSGMLAMCCKGGSACY